MRKRYVVSNSTPVVRPGVCVHLSFRWFNCALIQAIFVMGAVSGCQKPRSSPVSAQRESAISVDVHSDGISIKTPTVKFELLRTGYLRGFLNVNGRDLTLDHPAAKGPSDPDYLVIAGKEVRDFELDLAHAEISDAGHRLGPLGKRIVIRGASKSMPGLEKTVTVEVYDNFPSMALTMAAWLCTVTS